MALLSRTLRSFGSAGAAFVSVLVSDAGTGEGERVGAGSDREEEEEEEEEEDDDDEDDAEEEGAGEAAGVDACEGSVLTLEEIRVMTPTPIVFPSSRRMKRPN